MAVPPDHLSKAEIDQLHSLGVRGVRFRAIRADGISRRSYQSLPQRFTKEGGTFEFYAHTGGITDSADALLALPNDIVLDHFGTIEADKGLNQPAFNTILRMLDTGRVWIKLSGPMRCSKLDPPYEDVTPFARALVAHAPGRMVWGSDWPHPNMNDQVMPNDGDLLDLMLDWVPDEVTRNQILADNARQLYDFGAVTARAGDAGLPT